MKYTILDIIQNLINIEKEISNIFCKIKENTKGFSMKISLLAKTIEKQEKKHVEYYENLIHTLKGKLDETIDFYLYDKVSKLLHEYKTHIQIPEVNTAKDIIEFAIELEKSNIGLLLDIQGRLVLNTDDVYKAVYKVISVIVNEEREHEKMFQKLLNPMN